MLRILVPSVEFRCLRFAHCSIHIPNKMPLVDGWTEFAEETTCLHMRWSKIKSIVLNRGIAFSVRIFVRYGCVPLVSFDLENVHLNGQT